MPMNVVKDNAAKQLKNELKKFGGPWHSPIDLGHGVITNDRRSTQRRFARRLRLQQIPDDLTNKTVLDIGAWDGFFSFEFERRGAKVLSIDIWDEVALARFLFAREKLNSKVEYKRIDVHDLDPDVIGKFDIVFCAGVLYHLRNPLQALERIRSVTKELLILETVTMVPFTHESFPMIGFFPGDQEAIASGRDWGICAAPTISWSKEALASAGFTKVEVKHTPSMRWWHKFMALLTNSPRGGRGIFHAFPE